MEPQRFARSGFDLVDIRLEALPEDGLLVFATKSGAGGRLRLVMRRALLRRQRLRVVHHATKQFRVVIRLARIVLFHVACLPGPGAMARVEH